jgi:hypothetical protein
MNARIRKLARQSTGDGTIYMLEEEWLKFAELIVEECAEQVKNLRVNGYGISDAEIIRKHFRS